MTRKNGILIVVALPSAIVVFGTVDHDARLHPELETRTPGLNVVVAGTDEPGFPGRRLETGARTSTSTVKD